MENVIRGIFLGYGGSTNTFIQYGMHFWATHATFDEAELNTLPHDLSPDSEALWNALSRQPGAPLDSHAGVLTPLMIYVCLPSQLHSYTHMLCISLSPILSTLSV